MVVFRWNQVWGSFGFDLNFEFSRAHSSASFFLILAHARCSSATAACCRAHCRLLHSLCCRRMCACVSAQVPGTAQGPSRHLSTCAPRRRNQPPHAEPLPYTRPRQAIECVASPSRSCSHATVRLRFSLPERVHALVFSAPIVTELTSPSPHRYAALEQPPRGSMEER
jgi:hypothetical protein